MTTKQILVLLAILIGLVAVVAMLPASNTEQEAVQLPASEMLKNTTIIAPETNKEVALVSGTGYYEIVPGAASRGEVTVLDTHAVWEYGETTDLSAILTVNEGGSGTMYYLVLFDVTGSILTKKSEVFLGDRIRVVDMGIGELVHGDAEYRIEVQILTRHEGEAMTTEPTVEQARRFYVKDQRLEEVIIDLAQGDT